MGKNMIIQGTDVSFYIPPTGIEVVPDRRGQYVRDAVLERLEYCILLNEDGNKRYISVLLWSSQNPQRPLSP